jgi:hypothetical protein
MPLSRLSSFAGAFVIQLHTDADVKEHRLAGRVEHVRTGDSALFGSLEDLLRFMDACLAIDREASAVRPPPAEGVQP